MTSLITSWPMAKYHALGNDFIVAHAADAPPGALDNLAEWARRVCDRRRGVGADGMLIDTLPPTAQRPVGGTPAGRMTLFNADGSRAEMSGNGIRCFAHAVLRRSGDEVSTLIVATDVGDRELAVHEVIDDAREIRVGVDMGPVGALPEPSGWAALGCDPMRPVQHLSLGNPHSVVGVDDVHAVDLGSLGAQVPHVNLEIVEPGPEPSAITMRVHERGVGITQACGTGACASAWAASSWGLVPSETQEIVVHMDGGDATVLLHHPARGRVTLVGPSRYVADVTFAL